MIELYFFVCRENVSFFTIRFASDRYSFKFISLHGDEAASESNGGKERGNTTQTETVKATRQDEWHLHDLILKILVGPKFNEVCSHLCVTFTASQHKRSHPKLHNNARRKGKVS